MLVYRCRVRERQRMGVARSFISTQESASNQEVWENSIRYRPISVNMINVKKWKRGRQSFQASSWETKKLTILAYTWLPYATILYLDIQPLFMPKYIIETERVLVTVVNGLLLALCLYYVISFYTIDKYSPRRTRNFHWSWLVSIVTSLCIPKQSFVFPKLLILAQCFEKNHICYLCEELFTNVLEVKRPWNDYWVQFNLKLM